jgi:hypothetical protein
MGKKQLFLSYLLPINFSIPLPSCPTPKITIFSTIEAICGKNLLVLDRKDA